MKKVIFLNWRLGKSFKEVREIEVQWVHCPICKNKTRVKIRFDTELKNYPLFCPKCKQETLIEAKDLKIAVIREPDAQPINLWSIITVYWLYLYI